jgi:hypothetical protein
LFIGFKVEKGVDTSESFTNSTGEPSIAAEVNGKLASARDARNNTAGGNIDGGAIDAFLKGAGNIVKGVADSVSRTAGMGDIASTLTSGAVLDFPEVWQGSSFSRSYNFSMSLHAHYADPWTILQRLYIPLAMLLAGGLPRSYGATSYGSPFVCRAYCKGMFAVPLGIIDSITVKRGADQFGWSNARLPTVIDLSFSIKDLSPALYLAISAGDTIEVFKDIFAQNSSFQEYLLTLSGVGLYERVTNLSNMRKKAEACLKILGSNQFSPFYLGHAFGQSTLGRALGAITPSRIPNN